MMEGMSINQLIGRIDECSINYNFNNDDDLFYNDFIINYEEV